MNKLKIQKETLLKLNQNDAEKVMAGLRYTLTNCADACTDSCILTNRYVHCCQ